MKLDYCEVLAMFLVTLLPTGLIGALVFMYGQPYGRALTMVALMIFIALVVLWIVTRIRRERNNNSDKVILTEDPENPAIEEIPNKSEVLKTPIFTPIISNTQRARQLAFTPINNLPVITNQVNSSVSVIGVCPVHGSQQPRVDSIQDVTNTKQFPHT